MFVLLFGSFVMGCGLSTTSLGIYSILINHMKNLYYLLLIIGLIFIGCSLKKDFQKEEIINQSECSDFVEVETIRRDSLETMSYCIVKFEQLSKMYNRSKLTYIGSNNQYHFFFLYEKIAYEPNSMNRFAVNKRDYTPKNEFFEIGKNCESPFP